MYTKLGIGYLKKNNFQFESHQDQNIVLDQLLLVLPQLRFCIPN